MKARGLTCLFSSGQDLIVGQQSNTTLCSWRKLIKSSPIKSVRAADNTTTRKLLWSASCYHQAQQQGTEMYIAASLPASRHRGGHTELL